MFDFLQILLNYWQQILHNLTLLDITLMGSNIVLIIFAGTIISRFSHVHSEDAEYSRQIYIFRALNLLILLTLLFYNTRMPIHDKTWITRFLSVVLIIALGYLSFHIIAYFLRKRFGKKREVNGEYHIAETYNSRVLTIFSGVFILIIVLLSAIRLFGFNSLLEAGGVLGIIGVFLALTQASWAPDMISGLIILNSSILEEGDVIEFAEKPGSVAMIYKTKIFHTELLNLVNNHRIMVRNALLRDYPIHNLSRFASSKGLRELLEFNIAYEVPVSHVENVLKESFLQACADPECAIEDQHEVEIRLLKTGDYALKWGLFYYTKDVRNIVKTRQSLMLHVHRATQDKNIALKTPMLAQLVEHSSE